MSPSLQASSDAKSVREIERIEVFGYKYLTLYKKEWRGKRIEFMDFFNANIGNKDLKFDCRRRDAANTRIKRSVCKNVFDWRIEQEEFERNVREGLDIVQAQAFAKLGTAEQDELSEVKTAEIRRMLTDFEEFQQIYADLKKRK